MKIIFINGIRADEEDLKRLYKYNPNEVLDSVYYNQNEIHIFLNENV